MKIRNSLLPAILLLLCSCSQKIVKTGTSQNELKVLTYNIHHANPPSKTDVIDIDAIVGVIKRENPDIIAVQEVDKMVDRSGNIDEAKMIAQKTGMKYHFFKSIDYGGGDYGVAIFSKLDIKNPKQIILPKLEEKAETRTLGYVEIRHPGGQKIIFACTHLCVEGDASRVLQVKAILKELGETDEPVILCGDLNSSKGSEPIDLLLQQFQNSCTDNCGFTIPAVKPRKNIDFILTKNASWQVKDYHVVDEAYASDHRPVAATFVIHP